MFGLSDQERINYIFEKLYNMCKSEEQFAKIKYLKEIYPLFAIEMKKQNKNPVQEFLNIYLTKRK